MHRSRRRFAMMAGSSRRSFDSAIGAEIVVRAVAVVLAVGLVVFVLVTDQVGQREAVMHCDVIDAAAGAAAVMLILRRRAGQGMGEIADQIAFAAPEAP